jgi:hypothetical protein
VPRRDHRPALLMREGLTDAEAQVRLARDGPNELPVS